MLAFFFSNQRAEQTDAFVYRFGETLLFEGRPGKAFSNFHQQIRKYLHNFGVLKSALHEWRCSGFDSRYDNIVVSIKHSYWNFDWHLMCFIYTLLVWCGTQSMVGVKWESLGVLCMALMWMCAFACALENWSNAQNGRMAYVDVLNCTKSK